MPSYARASFCPKSAMQRPLRRSGQPGFRDGSQRQYRDRHVRREPPSPHGHGTGGARRGGRGDDRQYLRCRRPSPAGAAIGCRHRAAHDPNVLHAHRQGGDHDPVGRVTTFGYDALGRPAQFSNSAIQSAPLVQRAYTPDGWTASLTIARNNTTFNVTNFAYDGFDRLATTTYPDSSTETLGYDADGNVLTRKTRAAQTITFTYDTLNRLATKAAPLEPTVTYTYDLAGRLIGASDTSAAITALVSPSGTLGTASMTYDQVNRPLSFTFGPAPAQTAPTAGSSAFSYAYDLTNRRIGQTATDN